jgi:uncharacterized membrane protein YkvA (DUF1232 family)
VSWWFWALIALTVIVLVWSVLVLFLIAAGRRTEARAFAGFLPDCIVLVGRLLRDPRVPRRRKLLLAAAAAYLALPFDLVPDFIPVAGQLDDAIVLALALRGLLRSGGAELIRENWPGPELTLALLIDRGDGIPSSPRKT